MKPPAMEEWTAPGAWWDSRFWLPPTKSELLTRFRHPVPKFRCVSDLMLCRDGVWRIQSHGEPTRILSQAEASEYLSVSLSTLDLWVPLYRRQRWALPPSFTKPQKKNGKRKQSRKPGEIAEWYAKVRYAPQYQHRRPKRVETKGARLVAWWQVVAPPVAA